MPKVKRGSINTLAGILTTLNLSVTSLAASGPRGSNGTGDAAFDAMLYRARDAQFCELPIQLICRDTPGQGSITGKFYPDSFFLFSLDPSSRRVQGGLYRLEGDRLRLLFPSTPSGPVVFDGKDGVSYWNVEASTYRIMAGGAEGALKLLFKDVKATQAYSYNCSAIVYPRREADIRPIGCSSQYYSRKLMKMDGATVTLPVFHLDRDPNIDDGDASGGNAIDASVYRIDCDAGSYTYVSRGWLNDLTSLRYTAVDTLPATSNDISGSRILRSLYPDICQP